MTSDQNHQQPAAPKLNRAEDDLHVPVMSDATRRTFEMISDPKNAHLFTAEAARKAFAHIKV